MQEQETTGRGAASSVEAPSGGSRERRSAEDRVGARPDARAETVEIAVAGSPIESIPAEGTSEVGACPTELQEDLTAAENRAWIAFLRAHSSVTRRLEADLLAAGRLPLAEYDVLTQLAAADGGRLRMHELADRVLLSRAGLTRLIDRLVDDGMVERAKCGGDGRGAFAVLTARGRELFRSVAPQHVDSVKRHFLDAFDEGELESLAELLERAQAR